jgi:hypothetical protein
VFCRPFEVIHRRGTEDAEVRRGKIDVPLRTSASFLPLR